MSRIGRRPVALPPSVEVRVENGRLHCKGPQGALELEIPPTLRIETTATELRILAREEKLTRETRCAWGTTRARAQNMVQGTAEGFRVDLQLVGVGYRAEVNGRAVGLSLGFSHPVKCPLPEGVNAKVENNTLIRLDSHDKALLGQTAARIRAYRPPEPYQGKGVRLTTEHVRRKAGKK